MTTITYQALQTDSLLSINFEPIASNFKTIDSFIKNFTQFQRKFQELQKIQKATASDLSNFKTSTTNTFNTMNEVLDTRNSISNKIDISSNEEIVELKKQVKELRGLLSQYISDQQEEKQNLQLQNRQKEEKIEKQHLSIQNLIAEHKEKISELKTENTTLKNKCASKQETDSLRFEVKALSEEKLSPILSQFAQINETLKQLNPSLILSSLSEMKSTIVLQIKEFNKKLKLKTGYDDTLQLQDMILNLINRMDQNINKKFSKKSQTKNALIFIEKRINQVCRMIFGEEEGEKEALLVGKQWKCISCSKDLAQFEGKLDKYKPWSVFPTKEPVHGAKQKEAMDNKTKYSGFGQGFQSIVETAVTKKGGEIIYDQKGRMTTPFNLSREVQGNLLKPSQSQSKITSKQSSPSKGSHNFQMETNFMSIFGRNSQSDLDIKQEYMQKQKGLYSTIKNLLQSVNKSEQKN